MGNFDKDKFAVFVDFSHLETANQKLTAWKTPLTRVVMMLACTSQEISD